MKLSRLLCASLLTLVGGAGWKAVDAAAPTVPAAAPRPCDSAVGSVCDPASQAAFDRWGANLARLAETDLGIFDGTSATFPTTEANLAALTACRLISESPGTSDGERLWFTDFMKQRHPDVDLGEFHELFDAAMTVVCPELGYLRGFSWLGIAEGSPTDTVVDAAAGQPSWTFTSCEEALGPDPCTSGGFGPLYERWGARLPHLYNDPDNGYVGPPLGATYESDDVSFELVNMMALALCDLIDKLGVSGVEQWWAGQTQRYPAAGGHEHMLFFNSTLTVLCPDVGIPLR